MFKFSILALHFVLLIMLIFSGPAASESRKNLQWVEVPRKAMPIHGADRIIIELHVQDIDELTKASVSSTPSSTDTSDPEGARKKMASADKALTMAIRKTSNEVLGNLPQASHQVSRQYDFLPFVALSVTPDAYWTLQANPRIKAIYPDIPHPLPVYDSPEDLPLQEFDNLHDSDPVNPAMLSTISLIGADKAWAKGYSGIDWHVAVLDTGIRRTHQFFQGKSILEACFSLDEHCPNGESSMVGSGAAAHYSSAYQGFDHGTHVAGTAAGRKPDGSLNGIAKDADIIAVNVFSMFSASQCGGGSPCVMSYSSDQLAGLEYVYGLRDKLNVGAVNMSLGGGSYSANCDHIEYFPKYAIDLLRSANIPTAIATGNKSLCGAISAPACISSAIAVMASTKDDQETFFNNWHATLGDIFAPGHSILSATGGSDSAYSYWSGTSMATPHVAGALTLMRQSQPTNDPSKNLNRLKKNGATIPTLCSSGGSQSRLYVDNFNLIQMPGVLMLLLGED